jgi:hypothetical protein
MDGLPVENEASQYTKRNYDKDTSLDAAEETLASALRLRHRPLRDKLDNHNSKENPKKATTSDNIDGMHLCKDQTNSSYGGDETHSSQPNPGDGIVALCAQNEHEVAKHHANKTDSDDPVQDGRNFHLLFPLCFFVGSSEAWQGENVPPPASGNAVKNRYTIRL